MEAIRRHPPARLAAFFWAQLLYIPPVLCSAWYFGVWSWQYLAVFSLFTAVIIWSTSRLTWALLKTRQNRLRPAAATFLVALVMARIAWIGTVQPRSSFLAISIAEGFTLAWNGSLLSLLAPYTRRPDLYFPLALLWLCQSCWAFGWSLNWQMLASWNWVLPPLMGLLAFSFLAWRLKSQYPGQ